MKCGTKCQESGGRGQGAERPSLSRALLRALSNVPAMPGKCVKREGVKRDVKSYEIQTLSFGSGYAGLGKDCS